MTVCVYVCVSVSSSALGQGYICLAGLLLGSLAMFRYVQWRSKMADLEDRVRNLEESAQQKSVEHDEMVRKFEAEMQDLQKKLEEETLVGVFLCCSFFFFFLFLRVLVEASWNEELALDSTSWVLPHFFCSVLQNHMLALQSAPSPASGVAMVPPDTPLQRRNSVLEQTALWKARYEEVDRELTETRESLDVAVAKQQEAGMHSPPFRSNTGWPLFSVRGKPYLFLNGFFWEVSSCWLWRPIRVFAFVFHRASCCCCVVGARGS